MALPETINAVIKKETPNVVISEITSNLIVGVKKDLPNTVKIEPQSNLSITVGQTIGSTVNTDANYIHNQILASTLWNVSHNLNKKCSVVVVDSAGTVVYGDIQYIDDNTVNLMFSAAFSGSAFFN